MKKMMVLLLFLAGAACFITAGAKLSGQNAGAEEAPRKSGSPELLSDVNMPSYVSLPASFSNIDIVEDLDDIEVTEENADEVMYEQLISSAGKLSEVSEDTLLLVNYTVTKNNEVEAVESGLRLGYSERSVLYDRTVYDTLNGLTAGSPVRLEGVFFNGYSDCTLDITVTDIYDMPYPVTDEYIKEKTEYESVSAMRSHLINDAGGEAKEIARENTISKLIDIMMDQTTFIRMPDSLVARELQLVQKDNPGATYDDAKRSLQRIFFIAAVISNYDIAAQSDMDKRFDNLPEAEKEGLDEYEAERQKYLLYEEDVVMCIYRKVNISDQEG